MQQNSAQKAAESDWRVEVETEPDSRGSLGQKLLTNSRVSTRERLR